MEQKRAFGKLRSLLSRAKEASEEEGLRYVIRMGVKKARNYLVTSFWFYYYKMLKSRRTFAFRGDAYRYFYHRYNTTWRNERTVEIPIILEVLNKSKGKSILEVGNVLLHYFPVNHDVVDKYEKAEGVINRDIIDFHPSKEYDLIISISTLEHVGWDENVSDHKILHDPSKILRAIENLRGLLAPQGNIVVTLPLGLNPELDRLLRNSKVQFTELFCLKRVSKDNAWIEVDWQEAQTLRYNNPFPAANGLVIGIIKK